MTIHVKILKNMISFLFLLQQEFYRNFTGILQDFTNILYYFKLFHLILFLCILQIKMKNESKYANKF